MMFAFVTRAVRRRNLLAAGALYGLAMFASSFSSTSRPRRPSGLRDVIASTARAVGLGTFAVQQIIYGIAALAGHLLAATRGTTSANAHAEPQHSTRAA